jgi:hypothetical protein
MLSACTIATPSADYYEALRAQCAEGAKAACAAMPQAADEAAQEQKQIGALGGAFKPALTVSSKPSGAATY